MLWWQNDYSELGGNLVPGGKRLNSTKFQPVMSFPADAGDSFLIERAGDHLSIRGANDRSTLFGVYHVLESLGCGWFAPDPAGEAVPKQSTLLLTGLPYRCSTPFTRRGLLLVPETISGTK